MNLPLPAGFLDSYVLFSAISLAVILASLLLLIKTLAIFWLNEPVLFGSTAQNDDSKIPKILMTKVNVPFTFKLNDKQSSTYKGVYCCISSQVQYKLEAYWGVSIAELHHFLRRPWDSKPISTSLKGHFQHAATVIRDENHEDKMITLSFAEEQLELGAPPRQKYPLVIFLLRDSPDDTVHLPDDAVAIVNVVHIRDETCTLSSSILAQYLKQANGNLTTLKQLYMASVNSCDENDEVKVKKENAESLCIVCQVHPTSRALLPCRHTCVCAVCFNKLFGCPLCRSPISSYFLIREEEYYKESEKILCESDNTGTFSQWFHDRVADFLGFER